MHQAFYDSVRQVVWVVHDQVVILSRDGVPNQDEAAAQLLHWGYWMERWESHASGLGYRTSPAPGGQRTATRGTARVSPQTISVTCHCERQEIMVPMELFQRGETLPCGQDDCWPGCAAQSHWDAFEVTVEADRLVPVVRSDYDPVTDSYIAFRTGPQRDEHPDDLLLAGGPSLCYCGCGDRRKNLKGYFLQGHDQRVLGRLIRALRGQARVVLIDPDTGVVRETASPLDYAARFNTGKKDWVAEIERRVQLAPPSEPTADVVDLTPQSPASRRGAA